MTTDDLDREQESTAQPTIPGAPSSVTPAVTEPSQAGAPAPAKEDQRAPELVSATGAGATDPDPRAQSGARLTTAQGAPLADTDHSLKAGPRGPTLLQDHHLREKIMHFDHERIPERVVHARGAGARGVFRSYGTAAQVTKAAFLAGGQETPVFTRFSTVVGSRGSSDTVRDTRGFATKFYTDDGVFDLVANNMPVFFIQDGIKFPDIVHAAKPHPDREIPQAQSAHDTFWDFVSLHTEAQHHVMWQMSDRGIPRSFRMMEGFGVHTFRMINAAGETTLVKFHWKPRLGPHSLVWEEAQLVNGADPDFHRRDLYDAIEAGAYPQWELGIQVFPDTPEQTFEGIDLLDPTKIVPEELAPVHPVGELTLDAAPQNFFAEVEQVAFHPGHLVPGIDVTDDPLLQARLFSYLDTQITRLGGPNFGQIPVNRTHAPVNDMFRDGFHQQAVHQGVAPYRPNSLDGGCPVTAGEERAFIDMPQPLAAGRKVRESPASFADHHSQPRLFWRSLSPVERDHLVAGYTFELGKCYEEAVKQRQLESLARIDTDLCRRVADGLGLPVPDLQPVDVPLPVDASPALSQVGHRWPVDGRLVGIVVDDSSDLAAAASMQRALQQRGVLGLLVGPHGGRLHAGVVEVVLQRSYLTARSVEFDALLLGGSAAPAADAAPARDAKAGAASATGLDPRVALLVDECFRHCKPIGAWGPGRSVLERLLPGPDPRGVVSAAAVADLTEPLLDLLAAHRVWDRFGS